MGSDLELLGHTSWRIEHEDELTWWSTVQLLSIATTLFAWHSVSAVIQRLRQARLSR